MRNSNIVNKSPELKLLVLIWGRSAHNLTNTHINIVVRKKKRTTVDNSNTVVLLYIQYIYMLFIMFFLL